LERTLTVEASVVGFNKKKRRLQLGNLTDLNPDLLNPETGNVDINSFDTVLVLGSESGAAWTSYNAGAQPKAFDDAADIQEEFNEIKIFDVADSNPFGFY
jgi:hypothetical protein